MDAITLETGGSAAESGPDRRHLCQELPFFAKNLPLSVALPTPLSRQEMRPSRRRNLEMDRFLLQW
ncbi:MAG TPA: hypothetical protein VK862_19675 [Afifellaceae bacterium]|nr:hypothetical protein [Afifellaceae bacterium]